MATKKTKKTEITLLSEINRLSDTLYRTQTVRDAEAYIKFREDFVSVLDKFNVPMTNVISGRIPESMHNQSEEFVKATTILDELKRLYKSLGLKGKVESLNNNAGTNVESTQTGSTDDTNNTTTHNMEVNTMISLKQIAKETTTLSELMTNRDKVDVEFIIEKYPAGVTLNAVDLLTSEGKQYPVFTFVEDDTAFFFGGTVLMNIVSSWLKALNTTDIKEVSEALANEPVKVVLGTAKTKAGKNVTTVAVMD